MKWRGNWNIWREKKPTTARNSSGFAVFSGAGNDGGIVCVVFSQQLWIDDRRVSTQTAPTSWPTSVCAVASWGRSVTHSSHLAWLGVVVSWMFVAYVYSVYIAGMGQVLKVHVMRHFQ